MPRSTQPVDPMATDQRNAIEGVSVDPAIIATIIGAGGLAALIPQIFSGVRGLLDGHHAQEKAENVDALAQRDAAIRERNAADRSRRIAVEHAATVRRIAIEHGLARYLPPWPGEPGTHPIEPPGDGHPSDDPTH